MFLRIVNLKDILPFFCYMRCAYETLNFYAIRLSYICLCPSYALLVSSSYFLIFSFWRWCWSVNSQCKNTHLTAYTGTAADPFSPFDLTFWALITSPTAVQPPWYYLTRSQFISHILHQLFHFLLFKKIQAI